MLNIMRIVLLTLVIDAATTEIWIDTRDFLFGYKPPISLEQIVDFKCMLWMKGIRKCHDGDQEKI